MIAFRRSDAATVNDLLARWGHYLGPQRGPRMVLWYVLLLEGEPVSVAVSASPRGATCAGRPWEEVVELARLCSAPEHADMTRVALRCWRKLAAQDWADRYNKRVTLLAAYSDSARHPGNIYRFDGWTLYDERVRGSGGSTKGRKPQTVSRKRLWIWPVDPPAEPRLRQLSIAVHCGG